MDLSGNLDGVVVPVGRFSAALAVITGCEGFDAAVIPFPAIRSCCRLDTILPFRTASPSFQFLVHKLPIQSCLQENIMYDVAYL